MRVLIHKNREYLRCPGCNVLGGFHRSRVHNMYERFLKLLKFRYYRCKNCGWRGKFFGYTIAKHGIRSIFIYICIAVLTVFIVRFILNMVF